MRLVTSLLVEVLNPLYLLSLGIYVSIGYVLTLLFPVTIDTWVALFWASFLIPLVLLIIRAYRRHMRNAFSPEGFSWRSLLTFIPFLVLVPGLIAKVASPSLQIYHHGDFHGAYINQLLYGSTPTENIFLAGSPSNYYWLFHAYMAPIVQITSLSPLLVLTVFNIVAILSSLLWIARILIFLELCRPQTLFFGFAILFVYCSVNLIGVLSLLGQSFSSVEIAELGTTDSLRLMLLQKADLRLHSTWGKVLSVTSMPQGFACFVATLYACLRIISRKVDLFSLCLISASGIVAAAVQPIVTLYIVVLVVVLLLFEVSGVFLRPGYAPSNREHWLETLRSRRLRMWMSWLVLSAILSLPLLDYLQLAASNGPWQTLAVFITGEEILMVVSATLILIPFVALKTAFAFENGGRQRLYIRLCILLSLIAVVTIDFPYNNQYKGVFLLSILMSLSTLYAWHLPLWERNHFLRRARWLFICLLFVLVCLKVSYINFVFSTKQKNTFFYDGKHVSLTSQANKRVQAYYWIRENTPGDSVVVLPLHLGKFNYLLHERLPYVKASQWGFGETVPSYASRRDENALIYQRTTTVDEYKTIVQNMTNDVPGLAFYAVVRDREIDPEMMADLGAELVFEHCGDGGNVYFLNPDPAP